MKLVENCRLARIGPDRPACYGNSSVYREEW